ncbi:chalcone isomerase family protein [Celerinatantimonas yamalensis]|uniref:Chalcone isomerase family protein n=1 Tax=Celerinatantimonas yamalensis TaxID=559956 RepID=A0ABW9G9V9_9GAMM
MILNALLFAASLAAAEPKSNACPVPADQILLGQFTLTKWWFDIYRAQLYQAKGVQAAKQAKPGTQLQITYLRTITHQELVKQTRKEWQKIKMVQALPTQQWLDKLNTIWPNVHKGDCIAFSVTPNGTSRFYLGAQPIGTIDDKRFAKAFLSIWLSPDNGYPKQRQKLLGG